MVSLPEQMPASGLGQFSCPWLPAWVQAHCFKNTPLFLRMAGNRLHVSCLPDSKAIVDGNLKLILGLIWTLILHYSISMPVWEDEGDDDAKKQTPKQRLLGWIQNKIPYLPITNFNQNWQDGKALGALVDSCAPGKSFILMASVFLACCPCGCSS